MVPQLNACQLPSLGLLLMSSDFSSTPDFLQRTLISLFLYFFVCALRIPTCMNLCDSELSLFFFK